MPPSMDALRSMLTIIPAQKPRACEAPTISSLKNKEAVKVSCISWTDIVGRGMFARRGRWRGRLEDDDGESDRGDVILMGRHSDSRKDSLAMHLGSSNRTLSTSCEMQDRIWAIPRVTTLEAFSVELKLVLLPRGILEFRVC